MVADFFELSGWRTIFLGADLPADDIAQATIDFESDVVVLSATLTTQLPAVTATIAAIRSNRGCICRKSENPHGGTRSLYAARCQLAANGRLSRGSAHH